MANLCRAMQLGSLGSAVSSPSGSGWSPAAKQHLVHFLSENALSGKALNAARAFGGALSAVNSPSFNAARGLSSAVLLSSLSGSGRSPATKGHLVHFWSENTLSGKALNAARTSGGALYKLPQRVRAEPDCQTTFGAFLVCKCFIWQGPQCS